MARKKSQEMSIVQQLLNVPKYNLVSAQTRYQAKFLISKKRKIECIQINEVIPLIITVIIRGITSFN